MRGTADRIRHAISFEIIGLLTVTPLGALAFDHGVQDIGLVAIVGATLAMAWNYVFNIAFDHALLRWCGSVIKSIKLRLVHAVLFELGLLVALIPFIAWYLQVGLYEALIMDIAFSAYFLVYAFLFNWAYDLLFPVPSPTGG